MIKERLRRNSLALKTYRFLQGSYWNIVMRFWKLVPENFGAERTNELHSIAIVTYIERFDTYFKPLVIALTKLFPDTQIIIGINGFHDLEKQQAYLKKARAFLKQYKNIDVISFEEAQSLSKMWNLVIRQSVPERVLVLNDDLRISQFFRKELEKLEVLNADMVLINGSWSHFMISKTIIKTIGWFDERFPAMGNEDEDYECRLILSGISKMIFKMRSVQNVVAIPETYSFGDRPELINTKYVKANKLFFDSKWELSKIPKPDFVYVDMLGAYARLKPGMETPNFYSK